MRTERADSENCSLLVALFSRTQRVIQLAQLYARGYVKVVVVGLEWEKRRPREKERHAGLHLHFRRVVSICVLFLCLSIRHFTFLQSPRSYRKK